MPTGTTSDRDDPRLRNIQGDGQQEVYLVLSEEERAKGFIRPLRRSYKHVGSLRDADWPGAPTDAVERRGGCGGVTTMGLALCETYQRDPTFYARTFCATCRRHLPLDEFIWSEDGQEVGS